MLRTPDVASQSDLANWTLDAWARYYSDKDRSKVRNVISLEVSATELGATIQPPSVVAELDWVDKFWPQDQRAPWEYPKVQKYCLMSVAKCWTVRGLLACWKAADLHSRTGCASRDIQTSRLIIRKARRLCSLISLVPHPSRLQDLLLYSTNAIKPCSVRALVRLFRQAGEYLAGRRGGCGLRSQAEAGQHHDHTDRLDPCCCECESAREAPFSFRSLNSQYTPTDSLVFGGNFLHSLNIGTQLELHRIEIATKVPKKFRFPMFITLCAFAACRM
jgi:hypothetical protein